MRGLATSSRSRWHLSSRYRCCSRREFRNKVMSSATALRLVLATAVVLLQFFIAQTDHLCGLSGADSLVRGLAASVDATSAGLFLAGAYTFAFKGPPSRQEVRDYLQRWSKLHSDPVQNRKAGLKIDIRSNRFPRFTTITRVGKIQVRDSPTTFSIHSRGHC